MRGTASTAGRVGRGWYTTSSPSQPPTPGGRSMNLFVGNLFWEVTTDELEELFTPYGTVERCQIITDRDTGRSRGFGFVEMPDEAQAKEAVQDLHGMAH